MAGQTALPLQDDASLTTYFNQWMQEFDSLFDVGSEEYSQRRTIFQQNLQVSAGIRLAGTCGTIHTPSAPGCEAA